MLLYYEIFDNVVYECPQRIAAVWRRTAAAAIIIVKVAPKW